MKMNQKNWFKNIIFVTIVFFICLFFGFSSAINDISVFAENGEVGEQSVTPVDLRDLTGTNLRSDSVVKNLIGRKEYKGGFAFKCRVLLNKKDDYTAIGILQSESNVYSDNGYYLVFNGQEMGIIKGAFGDGTNFSFETKTSTSGIDWLDSYGVTIEFGAIDVYEGGEKTHVNVYVSVNGVEMLSYADTELRAFGEYIVASTYKKAILATTSTLKTDDLTQEDLYNVTGQSRRDRYATGVCLGSSSVDSNYEFRSKIRMYRGEEAVPIGILQSRADTWSGNGFYLIINEEHGIRIADNAYGNSEQGGEQDIASQYVRASYGPVDSLYEDDGGEIRFGAQYVRLGGDIIYTYVYAYLDGECVMAWYCPEVKPKGKYVIANTYACCIMETTRPMRTVTLAKEDGIVALGANATIFSDADGYFPLKVEVGYAVTGVSVNGQSLTFEETETGVSVFLPKTILENSVKLDVETERKTVNVYLPTDECRYLINNGEETQLGYRQALAIVVEAPIEKKISSFQVNGIEKVFALTEENGKYFYIQQALTTDITIEVQLTDKLFEVTTSCNEGGTVTSSLSQVLYGGSVKFTVVADEGFMVKTATVNGEEVSLDENGEIVVSDCTQTILCEVEFQQIQEDTGVVGCSASINGYILPIGIVCVMLACILLLRKRDNENE